MALRTDRHCPSAIARRGRQESDSERGAVKLGEGEAAERLVVVLQVNCTLGDVPRQRSVEGIRVALERNNFEYSEETSGRVIFLALRPEVSTPAKMPEPEAGPETSEQPRK
jgi:hypothetical protein